MEQISAESGRHLTRRKLLGLAAGGAGAALGVALLAPLASLGPGLRHEPAAAGAVAPRGPARRRAGTRAAGRRHRARHPAHRLSRRRGSRQPRVADRGRPARAGAARPSRRPRAAGPRRGSSPTRRSAPTRAAPCRSTARRTSSRPGRGPRSCVHVTTRRSIPRRAARSSSGPAGRPLPQLPLAVGPKGELIAPRRLLGRGRAVLVGSASE